ncbi:histidine kinase [Pontiellaceae bacterium B12227]|nr:histidine kinase [Pontiellaceae bacterium B12227]
MVKGTMQKTTIISIALLLSQACTPRPTAQKKHSTAQLEQRLEQIDTELGQLASYSLRSGAGANGYRSEAHATPDSPEWVEVDLGREISIDEIVLVPTLLRDTKKGFQAEGFPLEFRIIAGCTNDPGSIIASFTEQDKLLPRIAPMIVPCRGTTASWVRIEADQLSSRGIDEQFTMQWSELLIFCGSKNCALRRPVTTPVPDAQPISAWGARFLTDGSVPYLMDAASGDKGIAFLNSVGVADHPTLTLDLGAIYPVSQINLHAIDQSDTVPQAFYGDFGIPRHLKVEGATQPDFSDAVLLLDTYCQNIYDIAPIMTWNLPETACRFVRLTAIEPYIFDDGLHVGTRIGFAEIELFANGRNIAFNKPVSANFIIDSPNRPLSTLTDGLNFYGHILSTREWLNQLARRHDLETERPVVALELNHRYARQKTNLTLMGWLAALLTVGIGFTILIDRLIRVQQIDRMKEQFAADLHDELGANLHTIGLLSDLVIKKSTDLPEGTTNLLQRIRAMTKQSGIAVRHFANMQDANEIYTGLKVDMQRAADRIVGDLEHEVSIDGLEVLKHLQPRTRVDLLLFYKECLINICRHSGATRLSTRLSATPKQIQLEIRDNGSGMSDRIDQGVPPSLKRRARLLGARLSVESPEAGGTCIRLQLNLRKFGLKNRTTYEK